MRVVVDANVLVAALIRPDGWTARELRRDDVEWVAPETILDELRAHEDEIAEKAEVPRATLRRRAASVLKRIDIVPHEHLVAAAESDTVRRALEVDPKDALYLACVEAADAWLLWTRDEGLLEAFPGLAVRVVPQT